MEFIDGFECEDQIEECVVEISPSLKEKINLIILEAQSREFYTQFYALWEERENHWKQHREACLKREKAKLSLQQTNDLLSIYKEERSNLDENVLGKIRKGLEQVANTIRYVPEPHVPSAGAAAKGASVAANVINQIWTQANVTIAERSKQQAEKEYEAAKVEVEESSEKIVEYENQLIAIEETSHLEYSTALEHLSEKMHVRTTWDALQWEAWCELMLEKVEQAERARFVKVCKTQIPQLTEHIASQWQGAIRKKKRELLACKQYYAKEQQEQMIEITQTQEKYNLSKLEKESAISKYQFVNREIEKLKEILENLLMLEGDASEERQNPTLLIGQKEQYCKSFDELSRLSAKLPELNKVVTETCELELKDHIHIMEKQQVLEYSKNRFECSCPRIKRNCADWEKQMRNRWGEFDESYRPYAAWEGMEEELPHDENSINLPREMSSQISSRDYPEISLKRAILNGKQLLLDDLSFLQRSVTVGDVGKIAEEEVLSTSGTSNLGTQQHPTEKLHIDSPGNYLIDWNLAILSSTTEVQFISMYRNRWELRRKLITHRKRIQKLHWKLSCIKDNQSSSAEYDSQRSIFSFSTTMVQSRAPTGLSRYTMSTASSRTAAEAAPSANVSRLQRESEQCEEKEKAIFTEWCNAVDSAELHRMNTIDPRSLCLTQKDVIDAYAIADDRVLEEEEKLEKLRIEKEAARELQFSWESNVKRWKVMKSWEENRKELEKFQTQSDNKKQKQLSDALKVAEDKSRKEQLASTCEVLENQWNALAFLMIRNERALKMGQHTNMTENEIEKQLVTQLKQLDGNVVRRWNLYKRDKARLNVHDVDTAQQYIEKCIDDLCIDEAWKLEQKESECFFQRKGLSTLEIEYLKYVLQEALRHAVEKVDGVEEMWNEKVKKGKIALQQLNDTLTSLSTVDAKKKHAELVDGKTRLTVTVQAHEKAWRCYQKEKHRLDKIESIWASIDERKELLQKQEVEEAVCHYEIYQDSSAWKQLQPVVRESYNHRIRQENQWYYMEQMIEEGQLKEMSVCIRMQEEQEKQTIAQITNRFLGSSDKINIKFFKTQYLQRKIVFMKKKMEKLQARKWMEWKQSTIIDRQSQWIALLTEMLLDDSQFQEDIRYDLQIQADLMMAKSIKDYLLSIGFCGPVYNIPSQNHKLSLANNYYRALMSIASKFNTLIGNHKRTLKGHTKGINQLVVLLDGRLASGSYDKTIRIWNVSTGVCEFVLEDHSDWVTSLVVLFDGCLASGSFDKTIRIWNVSTGVCEHVLKGHTKSIYLLAVLLDGRLASGSQDSNIRIWNVSSGVCEHVLEGHSDWVRLLVVLLDGRLASGSQDNTIRIWNVSTGVCDHVLRGHTNEVYSLAVLLDGSLASGSGDSTIRIWNVSIGDYEHVLEGHTGWVCPLMVLLDGRLASGDSDNTIRIWNVSTSVCEHVLKGHTKCVSSLAVLLDGSLASVSHDRTIRIWNVSTGVCEHVLKGHTDSVGSLVALLDGCLASGCGDSTIRIWK